MPRRLYLARGHKRRSYDDRYLAQVAAGRWSVFRPPHGSGTDGAGGPSGRPVPGFRPADRTIIHAYAAQRASLPAKSAGAPRPAPRPPTPPPTPPGNPAPVARPRPVSPTPPPPTL